MRASPRHRLIDDSVGTERAIFSLFQPSAGPEADAAAAGGVVAYAGSGLSGYGNLIIQIIVLPQQLS